MDYTVSVYNTLLTEFKYGATFFVVIIIYNMFRQIVFGLTNTDYSNKLLSIYKQKTNF